MTGRIKLVQLGSMNSSSPDRQRLVVYFPADAATATGLDRLAGRQPGGLRSLPAG